MPKLLDHIQGFILDLDGVVYEGDRLLSGAREFFSLIHGSGRQLVALTNHSGASAAQVSCKLARLGIALEPERIVTSGWATARYLSTLPNPKVWLLGSPALRDELRQAGLEFSDRPTHVVVGYTRDLSYADLSQAVQHLRSGATLIGTNPDALLPSPQGPIPETGPLLSYLEYASGTTATVLGKPNPFIVRLALERMGLPAARVAMVGDTFATDIKAALEANLLAILLRTGNGSQPLPPKQKPTLHLAGLLELTALLSG